ncbi:MULTISPECIES: hypothetical protein [unclassified Uliginosibacterium]|jgi:hypothetical protein|uniref:DUF3024 domain-containing protein n=1 Tax=unclassified Uliginosibacterium TaxID=2621521 RepID=UPI000C796691|nr:MULTISPECIES: hypothetical protein [unclassified Uliginosibacterium]PLK47794.1 hypothetical protein C0V76_15615 [Uliginosibacterium sp. TH139]
MAVARLPSLLKPANPLVSERELTRRRIARALGERKRYRYVKPAVTTTEEGWLITSPCCSRNVDPDGGVIDIARLSRHEGEWSLLARDASRSGWLIHATATRLEALLKILCEDEERVFWP